jgi:flagellar capping protein FliD
VILTYIRTGRKDRASEIKEDDLKINGIRESLLKANLKLDQVCTTTTETRTDIKSLNRDLKDMDTRVVILERDMKTAFGIIDELKEKVDAS